MRFNETPVLKLAPYLHLIKLIILSVLFIFLLQGCKKEVMPESSEELAAATKPKPGNLKAVGIELIADGMSSPLGAEEAPDGSKRLFVFDQKGQIWIIDAAGNRMSQPFLDISSKMVTLSTFYDERG